MEVILEKSSQQNRGMTPDSSPKPIILQNKIFKLLKWYKVTGKSKKNK